MRGLTGVVDVASGTAAIERAWAGREKDRAEAEYWVRATRAEAIFGLGAIGS